MTFSLKDKLRSSLESKSYEFVAPKKQVTSEQLNDILLTEASNLVINKKRELRPKLISKNGVLQTENANNKCEACDKQDILFEVGKLLLCQECRKVELDALASSGTTEKKDTTKDNGVWQASIDNLKNPKPEVPNWARSAEDKYFEFFNRDSLFIIVDNTITKKDCDINKLTDEELRDNIIAEGALLFEIKVKQQKKVITYNERIAKKSAEERKKLQLGDLTYRPEDPIEASPVEEIRKRRNKEEQAKDSLAKLGLNLDDFAKKFKIGKK